MLEDPSVHERRALHIPRASLVLGAHEINGIRTELWMGGAHSMAGDAWVVEELSSSWVIDCAGEIDGSFRGAAGNWLACVFPDLDGPLSSSNRVAETVTAALQAMTSGNATPPERMYVMCQHGMNRSGLVTGLILRGLGLAPREAVERIRTARPGALANDAFRLMVLRD